jgi:hypothetical protein
MDPRGAAGGRQRGVAEGRLAVAEGRLAESDERTPAGTPVA